MSRLSLITRAILVATALTAFSATAQESQEAFASANSDFEADNFEQALEKYEDLVENGLISADLYFNLGTTLYRLENPGKAMLWFRRARIVEPGAPEVPQNLEFLKRKIGFLEFADQGLANFLRTFPAGTGKWLGSILLWTGAISLAAGCCLPALRQRRSGLIVLAIILGMFGYVALRLNHYERTQLAPENFATVIQADVKALTAPSPSSKVVIDLPPGSEVRIIQESGQWRYIDIPGELRGWVRAEHIEPIWPIPAPTS